jgi:cyclohexadienyl dehydratase
LQLGDQIISQIALLLAMNIPLAPADPDSLGNYLTTDKLSDLDKRALLAALGQIQLAPHPGQEQANKSNVLQRIHTRGELRVGTTGDYAPFSYSARGSLAGIDIDLAVHLGESLGVPVRWVITSWPALLEDLQANKYDIAMSGISWNPERAENAYYSIGYHHGGKSWITRCDDLARFGSLAAIDQPGVRLIVNPGGTNQKFVSDRIKQAEVQVFNDNTRIFGEIIANRADVMITDLIEVRLQSTLHPELCGSTGGETLSYQEKAYLLPEDITWKRYVDNWLSQQIQSGALALVFHKHLEN